MSESLNLEGLFSQRTAFLGGSKVRELFRVADLPGVVSLAGGTPFISPELIGQFAEAISAMMPERGALALQYGSGQGQSTFREQISSLLAEEGVGAPPEQLVITTGSQNALELLGKLLLDPGDVVVAEAPTYLTAIVVFRSFQADVQQVETDDHGLIPEALEQHLELMARKGRRVKALYTVANFSNPSGVTLSAERRPRILEICRRHGVLVLEDNPYGLLYFDEPPPATMRSLDPNVVYLGTLSKVLSPGFRVGWVLSSPEMTRKLILANEEAVLSPSTFGQLAISYYLSRFDLLEHISQHRQLYRERKHALAAALKQYFPECKATDPKGGFFSWVQLPDDFPADADQLLKVALEELVAYVPGSAFYADPLEGAHYMRLAFCLPTPEQIGVGVERLRRAYERVIADGYPRR